MREIGMIRYMYLRPLETYVGTSLSQVDKMSILVELFHRRRYLKQNLTNADIYDRHTAMAFNKLASLRQGETNS